MPFRQNVSYGNIFFDFRFFKYSIRKSNDKQIILEIQNDMFKLKSQTTRNCDHLMTQFGKINKGKFTTYFVKLLNILCSLL